MEHNYSNWKLSSPSYKHKKKKKKESIALLITASD